MSSEDCKNTLPATAKDALIEYLCRLENEYLKWYQSTAKTAFGRWKRSQQSILILGFATTLFAAISQTVAGDTRDRIVYLLMTLW